MLDFWPPEPERISSCGFRTPGLRSLLQQPQNTCTTAHPSNNCECQGEGRAGRWTRTRHELGGLLSGEAPPRESCSRGPDAPPCASKANSVEGFASQGRQPPATPHHPACPAPAQRGWVGRAANAQAEGVPPPGPPPPPRLIILELHPQGVRLSSLKVAAHGIQCPPSWYFQGLEAS